MGAGLSSRGSIAGAAKAGCLNRQADGLSLDHRRIMNNLLLMRLIMQRIITEYQIPTGDFRRVKYVGAIKDRVDDGNSVRVWAVDPQSPFFQQIGAGPVDSWTDVLIDVEDPDSAETLGRLKRAVEARLVQQLG